MFYSSKYIFIAALITIFSGCLATTNLLTDGSLNSEDLSVAREMSELTTRHCVRVSYAGNSEEPTNKIKFTSLPEVKAFYSSTDNWYKADLLLDGVWDSAFFQKTSKRLVCGQKQWDKYSESKELQFKKRGVLEKSLNEIAYVPTVTPKRQITTEEKLSEVKSLFNKNLITSQQYDEQVKRILANQ